MDIRVIDKRMAESDGSTISEIKYYNLNNEYLRGRAFDTGFHRLRNSDFISESVQTLQKHSSGINISFKTNSDIIKIKAVLPNKAYMNHMTAIGQIGFDIYIKNNDKYLFLAATNVNAKEYDITLVRNLGNKEKEFRLYFPLYCEVLEAYIGVEENASFEFVKYTQEKVVIYGTSISQGGCVTRPGMSYTNILDRITNYEYINLGFSGSAHLQLEVANILNEIEMKYLILEVEANNSQTALMEKLPRFIQELECEHIFLISHFPETRTVFDQAYNKVFKENSDFQNAQNKVTFIDGNKLLESLDYEGTVDGVHLTDLGFYVLAKKLKDYLQ